MEQRIITNLIFLAIFEIWEILTRLELKLIVWISLILELWGIVLAFSCEMFEYTTIVREAATYRLIHTLLWIILTICQCNIIIGLIAMLTWIVCLTNVITITTSTLTLT